MGDIADYYLDMMMMYEDGAEVEEPIVVKYAELIRSTEKAWLLKLSNSEDMVWFPKSKCTLDEDSLEILLPIWLALKKSLL